MATIDELISRGEQIRVEKTQGENSAERVGSWTKDMAQFVKGQAIELANKVTKSTLTQTLGTATDKAPSEKAVAEAFRSSTLLATESANGLMSAEQVKQLNEITEYMKPIEERYNSCVFIQLKNEGPFSFTEVFSFESLTDTAHIETDGFLVKIKVAVGWNSWPIQVLNPNGYVKLYWNGREGFGTGGQLYSLVDKIQVASSTLRYLWLDVGQYRIIDTTGASNLFDSQTWNNNRLVSLDLTKNFLLCRATAAGCQSLTHVRIDGSYLTYGNFLDSPKLSDLSFVAEALNELIELNIVHTAITKAVLLAIEAKWTSRVGKSAGILWLNEALFNELSTVEKSLFINKNITFNIA